MKMSQIYERVVYLKPGIDFRDPKVILREKRLQRLSERQSERIEQIDEAVAHRLKVVK